MTSRSVLVIEDNAFLRELLAIALESKGFFVKTAGNAADAKRIFGGLEPDGVVIDIDLGPGPNGVDLAKIFLNDSPGLGVVFLTEFPDARFASIDPKEMPKKIVYLRKSALDDVDVFCDAVDNAIRGVTPESLRHDQEPNRPLAHLTKKQIEILRLLAQGKSNAQIAGNRGISIKSVEDAVRRSCEAIGVDQTNELNARTAAVRRFLADAGFNSI